MHEKKNVPLKITTARRRRKRHRGRRRATHTKNNKKGVIITKHIRTPDKDLIRLQNTTPLADQNKGAEILKLIMSGPRRSVIRKNSRKSFSPNINRRLIAMTSQIASNAPIAECNSSNIMNPNYFSQRRTPKTKKNIDFFVNIGTTSVPNCVKFNTKKAIEIMLDNFSKSKHLNCNNIIAPKQMNTNCWFNTMFMIFFISDKGRKFFRFFRQLMIEGKTSSGHKIKHVLHKAFFLFNLTIEACYNQGNKEITRGLATSLDTNNIIIKIWKSIPKKHREKGGIAKTNESSNPLKFYKSLMAYLSNNDVSMMVMSEDDVGCGEHFSQENVSNFFIHGGDWNGPMDLFVIIIHDSESQEGINFSATMHKETEYTLDIDGDRIQYVLDSVVIRDTKQFHFCATLTCSGADFGFDGASYSRMTPFPWKDKINNDIEWTFDGSIWKGGGDDSDLKRMHGDPIKWNFKNGYQMLFYYRI
jgi:hypothetical protein